MSSMGTHRILRYNDTDLRKYMLNVKGKIEVVADNKLIYTRKSRTNMKLLHCFV
jgi:hypothetical protein